MPEKVINFGHKQTSPNRYRVLPDVLREALRPLNYHAAGYSTAGDSIMIPGWDGVLPVKQLRAWLEVAPADILTFEVRRDSVVVTCDHERTRAVFLSCAFVQNEKTLLVLSPFAHEWTQPAPRPTRSELMTWLNIQRGHLHKIYATTKRDCPQYCKNQAENLKVALANLYRAFGRLQSGEWMQWVEAPATSSAYNSRRDYILDESVKLWESILQYRDAHNVTQWKNTTAERKITV